MKHWFICSLETFCCTSRVKLTIQDTWAKHSSKSLRFQRLHTDLLAIGFPRWATRYLSLASINSSTDWNFCSLRKVTSPENKAVKSVVATSNPPNELSIPDRSLQRLHEWQIRVWKDWKDPGMERFIWLRTNGRKLLLEMFCCTSRVKLAPQPAEVSFTVYSSLLKCQVLCTNTTTCWSVSYCIQQPTEVSGTV